MSFILEALKRADRERRLERAPDLSAVYEESNLTRHTNMRPWFWLCGSFLVGAIVVGLMLWPKGPGPVKSSLLKDKPVSLPLSAKEANKKEKTRPPFFAKGSEGLQVKRSSAETSGTQPVTGPLRKTKLARPITSVTEKMAQAKTEPKPVEKTPESQPVSSAGKVSGPVQGSVATVGKRQAVKPSPSPSVSSSSKKISMESVASDQRKAVDKQVEAATKEAVDRKRIEAVPLINGLPYEIKEKLGKLQINVHSYSKDSAERLVFINMHRYKVGDKIGEGGPLLKEITPDGVIIDYGEGEVRLQVGK